MTRKALCSIAVAVATLAGATLVPAAAARAAGALPSLGLPPVSELPPSIGGSAVVGSTLVCSQGQWLNGPTTYAYSWERDLITTASGPSAADTYQVTSADAGALITCTVTATNAAGSGLGVSTPVTPVTAPVSAVPLNQSPPAISGDPEAGQTLACSSGAWTNSPTTYAYSWQRDGADIGGATDDQYTLESGDVNQAITCMVQAGNSAGSGIPAVSLPVIPGSGAGGASGGGSPGGGTSSGSSSSRGSGSGHPSSRSGTPSLSAFSVSPRRMIVASRRGRRSSSGVTFRFAIDRGAEVAIVIERERPGIRVARCRSARHRRRASCARYVVVRTLTVAESGPGTHTLRWSGRPGLRFLASGGYLAYAAAVTSGGWSATRATSFAVVRRHLTR